MNSKKLSFSNDHHVMVDTETWLTNELADNEVVPPGDKVIRRDRGPREGGVAIIVKNVLTCVVLGGTHENLWCQFKCEVVTTLLVVAYRSRCASP